MRTWPAFTKQRTEQAQFQGGEGCGSTVAQPEGQLGRVQRETATGQDGVGGDAVAMASKQRAGTGEEFPGIERVGQAVIDPGVEGGDGGLQVLATGQAQDRHGNVLRPQAAAARQALRSGQAAVHQEKVDPFPVEEGERCHDGGHRRDVVAGLHEQIAHQFALEGVVAHDEDTVAAGGRGQCRAP